MYILTTGFRPHAYKLTILGLFLGLFSLQVLANTLSGHGLFETTQNFNIYKLFYGVDWTNPPSPAEIEKFSLLEPLRENPQEFFGAMLPWFRFLASFAWPGIVCVLLARWKSVVSKFGLFSALTIIFYAIPLALGDSLRAQLTTMSLFLSSLGIGFSIFIEWIRKLSSSKRWLPNLAMALILLGGGYQILRWVPLDLGFLRRNRSEHRNFIKAEQSLLAHGMDSPDQVFADRLDFYLPNLPPYLPRQIEGFFYDWVWGYNLEYSPLPNDSWESFVQASHAQGIQYLVLSPNSAYRGDFFPPIYNEETDLNEAGLQFIAQIGRQRLYRLR